MLKTPSFLFSVLLSPPVYILPLSTSLFPLVFCSSSVPRLSFSPYTPPPAILLLPLLRSCPHLLLLSHLSSLCPSSPSYPPPPPPVLHPCHVCPPPHSPSSSSCLTSSSAPPLSPISFYSPILVPPSLEYLYYMSCVLYFIFTLSLSFQQPAQCSLYPCWTSSFWHVSSVYHEASAAKKLFVSWFIVASICSGCLKTPAGAPTVVKMTGSVSQTAIPLSHCQSAGQLGYCCSQAASHLARQLANQSVTRPANWTAGQPVPSVNPLIGKPAATQQVSQPTCHSTS